MSVIERIREAFAKARARRPELTEELSEEALIEILAALNGERVVFPKTTQGRPGRPAVPPAVQQAAHRDALAGQPDAAIIAKHGISRATLYRLVKRGPPGG